MTSELTPHQARALVDDLEARNIDVLAALHAALAPTTPFTATDDGATETPD